MSAFNYSVPPIESIVGSIQRDVTRYIDEICTELEITPSDLVSASRKQHLTDLRHLLMYILREEFQLTYDEIGRFFHRDHTSVIHGCKKMMLYIETKQINLFCGIYLQAAQTAYKNQWGRNLKIFQNGL